MNWNAAWIWHPPTDNMDNFYLYARKVLHLKGQPPKGAVLFVTAGSLYKLYINGQYVGRGPNPSDPSRYYYDVYEVGSLLRQGSNAIAAVCYNYGAKNKGVLGQNWGRGAFLLELRAGREGRVLLATDASWKVRQAPEWDQNASLNCNLYGDYKETIDSRREIPGWMEAAFDDGAWPAPEVLGRPPIEPYTGLVEREIPFLGGERAFPVDAWWESASLTYSWRDDWEFYHEHRLVPGSPYDGGVKFVEVQKTHEDFIPSLLLDFGQLVTGYPEIVVHSGAGGIIDVLYGEGLGLTRVDRFILRGGPQVLQPFNRRTFRYMKLQFPELPRRMELDRVSVDMNTYPVERKGAFACSDPLLNRIWEVGRHTMRMSMLDHFVDCPWRERTIYGGDVYNENLIAAYAFGDPRMNRKVLRQMFALQHAAGALPPYGPYRGGHGFYPSWTAFFGLAFLDHYELTADRAFLDELWPRFEKLLKWAAAEVERNSPHLIGNPAKGGSFQEWMKGDRVRFGAWDLFPFLVMLRRSASLAAELKQPKVAALCAKAATQMDEAVRRHMIDKDGLCHGLTAGAPAGAPTQSDNAYLLWSGMLGRTEGAALATKLFPTSLMPVNSPFFGLLLAEALFAYGEDERAIGFIRDYWGDLLARGATTFWEHFSQTLPPGMGPSRGTSYCHGWSAGPTYSLPAHVLGVRPLAPGFAKVLVEPRPCGLAWAAGEVPTPRGPVSVKWTSNAAEFRVEVHIPEGSTARLVLPCEGLHAALHLDGQAVEVKRENNTCAVEIGSGAHAAMVCQSVR